ncbi:MAG: N-formylglutamate amidohydrolase [Micavibrio sp.]
MTNLDKLLQDDEPAPYDLINLEGDPQLILTCEHAGDIVPRQLGLLGLEPEDFRCHYAVDVGVDDVTRELSRLMNAPAILGNYSRLVVDLNRTENHPMTFATTGEGKPVPGNIGISAEEGERRLREIYRPYHTALDGLIESVIARGYIPIVISVHSYTPVFFNFARPWEVGFMYASDDRVSLPLIRHFESLGYNVGKNQPYDRRVARGGAISRHAERRRLPCSMIEFRNDMISNKKDAHHWAKLFADGLQEVLADPSIRTYYDGPLTPFDPEKERTYFADIEERAKRGEP